MKRKFECWKCGRVNDFEDNVPVEAVAAHGGPIVKCRYCGARNKVDTRKGMIKK